MRKFIPFLCLIMAFPFILCSCFFNQDVEKITMNKTELTLSVGDSSEISVIYQPEDAKNKLLNWSSSNEKVATVSSDGIVKAKNTGDTVVTAIAQNGVKTSCNVTVDKIEVESIKLDNDSVNVDEGKCIQISAKVLPTTVKDETLDWSSSNEKVAIVNSSGYVTGVKSGSANILCESSNGKKASCTVTVKGKKTSSTSSKASSSQSSSKNISYYDYYGNPKNIGNSYKNDFVFYDSSYRLINTSELYGLSDDEIQRAINEIYARNGYVFKTQEFQDYYSSKDWYYPNPQFSLSDLNSVEQQNIALFSKYR